ncbi:MAG TPA: hypothetical protein VF070_35855 [Streptosporangiaceae bacterium]
MMSLPRVPDPLPPAVARPRRQVKAVMAQSLREQGATSRTAAAWRWALTGDVKSPVRQSPATGIPPDREQITAEARHDPRDDSPGYRRLAGPLWVGDRDLDRRFARLALLWLAGLHDLVPLSAADRGKYVGARLHFARTDDDILQVRVSVLNRILADPAPEPVSAAQAAGPWTMTAGQMNTFYLNGTLMFLMWIMGDGRDGPLTSERSAHIPPDADDIEIELAALDVILAQGRDPECPAEPGTYPPPQYGEGVDAAFRWLTGEDTRPPVDHHGCGAYFPCPGDRRCICEQARRCLHGQCPACATRPCGL